MTKQFKFSFNPRVITDLLGSQLVENVSIALAEQIKNSRDANAKKVTIKFEKDVIKIIDDGKGMSEEEVSNFWFNIGTTRKNGELDKLGGKGIGRLSLFTIGNSVDVITVHNKKQVTFHLEKSEIDKGMLNVNYELSPCNAKDKTVIIVKHLNEFLIDYDEIELSLENLFLDNTIEVELDFPKIENKHFLKTSEVIGRSLFVIDVIIRWENDKPVISYISKMNGIESKNFENTNFKYEKDLKKILTDYKMQKIGKIKFNALYFYKGSTFLKIINKYNEINNKDLSQNYLSYNSGINIYRNSTKIFNFGKNDWLNLTHSRLNNSSNVDNELISGQIILDTKSEEYLIEKTNREGLKASKQFSGLKSLMDLIIKQANDDRKKYATNKKIEELDEYLNSLNKKRETKEIKKKSDKESNKIEAKDNIPNLKNKSSSTFTTQQELFPTIDKNLSGNIHKPKISGKLQKSGAFIIPGYYGKNYVFNNLKGAGELLNELKRLSIEDNKLIYQISFRPILETSITELVKEQLIKDDSGDLEKNVKTVLELLMDNKDGILTKITKSNSNNDYFSFKNLKPFLAEMLRVLPSIAKISNLLTHRTGETFLPNDRMKEYTQNVYTFAALVDKWIDKSHESNK